jgi:hypothetical protein
VAVLLLMLVFAHGAAARWNPPQRLSWYWQLTGTVNNSYPAAAFDIDGFDNSAGEVATLHAGGKHVICYIDVGTWENWRSDASKFPSSVLGNDNGWPGERWLDIRRLSVLEPIMTARFQMCKQKGFDAVEPDNIDGFENNTGFSISAQDQLTYDEWVAGKVHSLGLSVLEKNDPGQAAQLQPYFDGVLDEQCNEYSECSAYKPYLSAGKPVLNAEYNLSTSQFCAADNAAGIMGALYSMNLDGSLYTPCWSGSPGFGPGRPSGSGTPGAPKNGRAKWSVGIAAGTLTDRHGSISVRLTCPRGQSYCLGTVTIDTAGHGGIDLGARTFRIPGGHSAADKINLASGALGKLKGTSSIRVMIKVSARDRVGQRASSQRATTLLLPERR